MKCPYTIWAFEYSLRRGGRAKSSAFSRTTLLNIALILFVLFSLFIVSGFSGLSGRGRSPLRVIQGGRFAKRPYFNSISRKLACQKKRSLSGLRFLFGPFFKMLFVRILFVRRSEDFKGSVIEKHANFLYSPFFFFGRLGSGRGKLKSCGFCVSVFLP